MGEKDKQQGSAEYPSVGRIVLVKLDEQEDHNVFRRPLIISSASREGQKVSGRLQWEPGDKYQGKICGEDDAPLFVKNTIDWIWPPRDSPYLGR